jgi:hypothetical protein
MPRKSAEALSAEMFLQQRAMQTATDANRSFWRKRYLETCKPNFKFDKGDRHYCSGREAKLRYLQLHGVPAQLIAEWDMERNNKRR